MKSLWLSILCLISFQAHATITIQSVGGVSYFEKDTNNNFTIYGGMTGRSPTVSTVVLDCTGDSSVTCNSCAAATTTPATACNPSSVYGSLKISITFSSSVALSAAKIKITTDNGISSSSEATEYALPLTTVTASAGQATTVTLDWNYLCSNDSHFSPGCLPAPVNSLETAFENTSRKIYLYVDQNADGDLSDSDEKVSIDAKLHYIKSDDASNNQQTFCHSRTEAGTTGAYGMCGYVLGIGDSKFYLQEVFGASVGGTGTAPYKSVNAPDWLGVALLAYDAANISSIPSSANFQIRKYTATFDIQENTVTGLDNYKNYCLLMGNINKAQNIYKFNIPGATTNDTCGQPSEVIGMLTDKSCFISTAAFGSDMADQVQLLRQFRNEFLLTNAWGKKFVKTYYKLSPPVAHFIENSEILKAMTRTALYPFIAMAWLAVNFGFLSTALLALFIFSSLYFVLKKRRTLHA